MSPEQSTDSHPATAMEVHRPVPLAPATVPVSLVPVQPGSVPAVASIVLPDGRVVTGYAIDPVQPEPLATKPLVSRTVVNIALGGIGFGAVCGGLLVLTTFIAALTALITQLITLAAVILGGWIAVLVIGPQHGNGGTVVHIRKAIFKRNRFNG